MSTDRVSAGPDFFGKTHYAVLGLAGLSHFLNDATQSLLVPSYPLFKDSFGLSFTQIGLITLTYQLTASLLQPAVGWFTDRHPLPFSLPVGMVFSLSGLLLMSVAPSYHFLLMAVALLGVGSSVFHPESSRVARLASGGQFGLAQSMFQVGGNAGTSIGPLLAAAVVIPFGQRSLSWFAVLPLAGICLLIYISRWARGQTRLNRAKAAPPAAPPVPRNIVTRTMAVLLILIFSKYFYLASITSYLIFYLTSTFGISDQAAQIHLFVFLFAVASGTLVGGPIGDRIGRKYVIWVSILGITPFTLPCLTPTSSGRPCSSLSSALPWPRPFRPWWCSPRSLCQGTWARYPGFFSGCRSASRASGPPCWAGWRTFTALPRSTTCALTCPF